MKCRARVAIVLSMWMASAVVSAAELTWSVDGTFADGGTFSGTFQENPGDPAERKPSIWDVGVAGGNVGNFPPRSFNPANSGVFMLNWPPNTELTYHFIDPNDGNKRQLRITPASPLDGSLTSVPLSLLAGNGRVECFNCAPYRNIVAGTFELESVTPTLVLESITPDPTTAGTTTTATISIDEIAAYGTPTGPVTVFDGLSTVCVITLPDTSCTFAAPATPGGQTAHAQYPGDANYGSAISNTLPYTIEPADVTAVTFVSILPDPTLVGQTTTATVEVEEIDLLGPPTGTVTVIDSYNQEFCTITLPDTQCSFEPIYQSTATVVAHYSGDVSYASGTSNSLPFIVGPAVSSVTLESLTPNPVAVGDTVTATITGPATVAPFPAPTGDVIVFNTSLETLCTITLPDTSCTFTPASPGNQLVTALYGGDANYEPDRSGELLLVVVGITSAEPPNGVVGVPYSHTYTTDFDPDGPAVAWAVTAGALPPGLTLDPGGLLSGIPTTVGTYTGTVTATVGSFTPTQDFSITILELPPNASSDAMYSNLATFRNQSFAAGGATLQLFNTITRMAADDLNLEGSPPYQVNGFRFTVTNLNDVDVSASPLVRFYHADGPDGGPGTLIAAFTYNPITFTAGRVGTIKTSTQFELPTSAIWAGIVFDNNGGATGATAAQLDNLAQGVFSPAEVGFSTDQYFVTTDAGSFTSDDPVGTLENFGGAPPADFGWEILAAQDVDLSITKSDGVETAIAGGSVVYTITASNAGPDTVFGARVVDDFPVSLTCNWTCAGSAGNTCAASGGGDINDATVGLAAGGSVTYTATCDVAPDATGTLVNTANFLAPDTAVEANVLNNNATDSDTIATLPGAPTIGTATPGDGQATVDFTPPVDDGGSPILSYTATCGTFSASAAAAPITVTGLTNGTEYLCSVTATNEAGEGPASGTVSVTPFGLPGAPVIGTATPGDGEATIAFTAPANDGGSAITGYTASCDGISAGGTVPSILVTGLTNGTAYDCSVTATNAAGEGPPSGTVSVTPFGLPGAPVIGAATPGDGQATVDFTPPADDGGSPILSYMATCGAFSATGPAAPLTVMGLTNGTEYTCSVTATNEAGEGPPSETVLVTPFWLPAAPVIGVATPGDTEATIAFTAPADDGGSTITGYTASCDGISANGTVPSILVTGLTNGTEYLCSVTATNEAGEGPPSDTVSVTPFGLPGAPVIGVATPGDGEATIAFTAPADDGGSAITSYTATCDGFSAAGAGSPILVTGLTNGTEYSCTVTATNAAGEGPASGTVSVTPLAPPVTTYTGPSATGTGSITASFTGGGPTCTYSDPQYIGAPPGAPPVPPSAPDDVTFPHGLFNFATTDCTAGSTLSFTITYPVALPPDTQYWKYGPTPGNTAPDWYTLPATVVGNTATFTIADGGLGDDDLAANGTIVDQGGPGILAPGPGNPIITVIKVFDDLNTAEVEVHLSCNGGLPLEQSFTLAPVYAGTPNIQVKFVLSDVPEGTDCTVSESPIPAGYVAEYRDLTGTGSADEEGCHYADVVGGNSMVCVVRNRVAPVSVTIEKVWEGVEDSLLAYSSIALDCSNVVAGSQTSWNWLSSSADGGDEFVAQVAPVWNGSTSCTVSESNTNSAVEVTGCEAPISVAVGQASAGCTLTNTVFYEGIPAFNRFGLALLALLMLGIGFIAFRRFA